MKEGKAETRVVVVDDHRMFREQLAHLIAKTGEIVVCGEADNVSDGFNVIDEQRPDVAIVDITLRGASGLELVKQLRANSIDVPVLILSMHDESLYAERALRAGARGYLTKHAASSEVIAAIRQVLRGEIFLNRDFMAAVANKMMDRQRSSDTAAVDPLERLTDRELEVFELMGRGLATREITLQLGIGSASVETYLRRIREKLRLENTSRLRAEATRWVHRGE